MIQNLHATTTSPINSKSIENMGHSWHYPTEHPVSHAPLVKEGAVYFGDWGGTIYKVDAKKGSLIWKKNIENPMTEWSWYGFAGTGTLGDGKVFEASVEGNAFALDQNSGELLWQTEFTTDPEAGNLSVLLYHDGLVYIGVSSVEEMLDSPSFTPDLQGKVIALDAKTGNKVWERFLVEPPQNGVPMWTSFALDTESNTLYFTTGNNYTGEEASKMSDAMVAVDSKTGDVKWFYQVTPHDLWTHHQKKGPDYDFSGGAQLFTAEIDGEMRKLVGAGQKSGVYTVWDAITGDKVWESVIGYGGVKGGLHSEASIADGTVYVWSNNNYAHKPPTDTPLTVKALDAATGELKWVANESQPASLVTGYLANDVYIVGSVEGTIQAYHAKDGKKIWSHKNPAPIISWLILDDDSLFLGGGIPKMFGEWAGSNKKGHGLYAYSLNH
ncbi:PQQ-binding-like beta-propeller repeat protein [Pricia sp. S334]|uniref:PQQ-binding-like beta-propeller repeat protein n=1 Tax=Pricia mediterranea TaxID=3076079 RepID=A0ABU3L0H3_9FLAO|nr:PQQ-binding-like beta-propeller repeat protein [Pricia sp. S334]MDT7827226.1 PQQ-binding-like beta-propeller repeat protein [Pricia sp. S334]